MLETYVWQFVLAVTAVSVLRHVEGRMSGRRRRQRSLPGDGRTESD